MFQGWVSSSIPSFIGYLYIINLLKGTHNKGYKRGISFLSDHTILLTIGSVVVYWSFFTSTVSSNMVIRYVDLYVEGKEF